MTAMQSGSVPPPQATPPITTPPVVSAPTMAAGIEATHGPVDTPANTSGAPPASTGTTGPVAPTVVTAGPVAAPAAPVVGGSAVPAGPLPAYGSDLRPPVVAAPAVPSVPTAPVSGAPVAPSASSAPSAGGALVSPVERAASKAVAGQAGASSSTMAGASGAITIGVATRKRWQTAVVTAVVTVCGILAAVAAVRMFRPVSMQVLAICVLVGLLVLIRMTPTVALWVARVRPPHFGSITGRDLFARRAGMPVDTVAPVSEADADDEDNELTDITARGTAIAASARLVNAVQVGMCVGVSLVLPAAVWGVLTPRQPWAWLALLVAGLTVGLFITQGRGFAAKYQAVALVCGASAAVCAGVLKYALDTPKGVQTGLLWPAIFVAAFAALGLAVALVVPATRFRPIIRLTVEWLEVLAMIALLPAAAALGGLFAWLRH